MLHHAVLFYLLYCSSCLVIKKVDITKINYCEKGCRVFKGRKVDYIEENTACHCFRNDTHTELLYQQIEFRTWMLKLQNGVRNRIASGKLKHKDGTYYPAASNMRALSYSLEAEYTARCWAVQIDDYHDKCRATSKHELVGQNLGFGGSPYEAYVTYGWGWFEEYNNYHPNFIDKFQSIPGVSTEKFAHFTQLAWADTYTVGCARSWNPTHPRAWRFALMCNYETMGYASNIVGAPLYKKGQPCSECPNGTTCNKIYTNLCGEIDPVPLDRPVDIYPRGSHPGSYGTRMVSNSMLVLGYGTVMVLCNYILNLIF